VLGFLIPLFQVLEVKAECSMPEQLIVSERDDMRIKISRRWWLGPLGFLLPIRYLRVIANLSRRIAGAKGSELILDPEPLLIPSLN
ncbi:hypothetical protein, partial [Sulfitobacter dubius]|uniref:hypothetical protein n=1 Tax=Sulfitobacter dubius TaxID=218673 RepID=UPI0022AF72ED